ncbi:hypothetical protein QBC47DRAFT_412644 [Echria macrotheca]|uniref:Uncharacterized protein n=1 Tax=Echria macrotheca TaxID=438768 RepID=A0AAJ0F6U2_9PEZI|nr:hypothetical protein QBC47DRAFT_412644 [Echria macrotheca]
MDDVPKEPGPPGGLSMLLEPSWGFPSQLPPSGVEGPRAPTPGSDTGPNKADETETQDGNLPQSSSGQDTSNPARPVSRPDDPTSSVLSPPDPSVPPHANSQKTPPDMSRPQEAPLQDQDTPEHKGEAGDSDDDNDISAALRKQALKKEEDAPRDSPECTQIDPTSPLINSTSIRPAPFLSKPAAVNPYLAQISFNSFLPAGSPTTNGQVRNKTPQNDRPPKLAHGRSTVENPRKRACKVDDGDDEYLPPRSRPRPTVRAPIAARNPMGPSPSSWKAGSDEALDRLVKSGGQQKAKSSNPSGPFRSSSPHTAATQKFEPMMSGALPVVPGRSQDEVSFIAEKEVRKSAASARTSHQTHSSIPSTETTTSNHPRRNWAATSGPEAVYGPTGRVFNHPSATTTTKLLEESVNHKEPTATMFETEEEELVRQYIVFRTPRFFPSAQKTKALLAVRCAEHATRVVANRHAKSRLEEIGGEDIVRKKWEVKEDDGLFGGYVKFVDCTVMYFWVSREMREVRVAAVAGEGGGDRGGWHQMMTRDGSGSSLGYPAGFAPDVSRKTTAGTAAAAAGVSGIGGTGSGLSATRFQDFRGQPVPLGGYGNPGSGQQLPRQIGQSLGGHGAGYSNGGWTSWSTAAE